METIKENIKMERYPEYRNSGEDWLGEVPVNWELTRLGTRFFERRAKVSDRDYAPLSVTKQGILPQLDSAAKTNDGDNRKLVKAGDFVINSRSDRKGSSGISNLDGSVSLINIVIEPKGINPIFCNYLFKSNGFIEEFYRNGHGIVADLWTTRYDEMKAIKIAIPSKSEQTRIATFLDRKTAQIDQAIAQKERLIELLIERRQILIHKAVTRGLNPNVRMKDSGVEWIGMIPEHWKMKKVKFSFKLVGGGTPSKERRDFWDGEIPWVSPKDMKADFIYSTEDNITEKGLRNSATALIQADSLLMVVRSGILQRTIPVAISKRLLSINQDMKAFVPIGEVLAYYLFHFVKGNDQFLKNDWVKQGATVESVEADLLKNGLIPIPPKFEQLAISEYIEIFSAKIATSISCKQAEIEKLKEYKATLINSAVTGKIKV